MNFTYEENVSLAPYCSMKAGGKAKYFVLPKSEQELVSALRFFRERGDKHIVVGNCSNLLFGDGGYEGAVIYAAGIRGASCENGVITAYCGETLSTLARVACEASVSGLEFCYGIPGTVGGAVYMNAGAYGGEISQSFIRGRFIDENNEIIVLTNEEMDFGYRKSRMNYENLVLVSAEFAGGVGDKVQIRARMDELMAKRKASQPLEYPSCGSAFKRPEGHYAGALIEQCGLKGKSIGGAQVSEVHANFIINKGGAKATDITELIDYIRNKAKTERGITLKAEVQVIGDREPQF